MPADVRTPVSQVADGGPDVRADSAPTSEVPEVAAAGGPVSGAQAPPAQWLGAICPYLRAEDGSWRSAVPAREHRCWAAEPPSTLPTATQQELCLSPAHGGCERFLRARDQRAAALAQDQIEVARIESARFGPFVSPVPIAVDARPLGGDHSRHSTVGRRRVPALLIGGGVILVGVVAFAAIFGGGRKAAVAVLAPSPVSSHVANVVPVATPTVAPVPTARSTTTPTAVPTSRVTPRSTGGAVAATAVPATPRPTATPTPKPPPTPKPTPTVKPAPTVKPTAGPAIARRYTVKQGDTIQSIANKFGLKPRDLRAVNAIGKDVVVGQRLRIPARSISAP